MVCKDEEAASAVALSSDHFACKLLTHSLDDDPETECES